jgi:hypothetical protein
LYSVIERNVIRSDRMFDDITGTDRLVLGSRVILCTISMLSNDRVMNSGLIRLTPVRTVIVDEASQIEIGDYLPIVDRFKTTLKKIACIGDDKQCEYQIILVLMYDIDGCTVPPFGQEDVAHLKSVFELDHLRHNEVFLDTQCLHSLLLG